MTSEREYFQDLAKLRQLLERSKSGDADLPADLLPEHQVVTDDIRTRAASVREAFLRGDRAAFMEADSGLSLAGFNRGSDEPPIDVPELDEARDRVKRRLAEGENGEEDEQSDTADCEDDPK